MSELRDAKKKYEEIEIPKELSERIQKAIEQSGEKHMKEEKVIKMNGKRKGFRNGMIAAAMVFAVFTAGVNTSTAFAQSVSRIPLIGAVARVLTFTSYEKTDELNDLKISVEVPSVEMISEDTNGLAQAVNEEIQTQCQNYAEEAIERAKEYRTAFLETGGTEEEWAEHNIEIKVFYEVKNQTEDYLSFAVTGTENWVSAYSETRYYNIDLKSDKMVTLKDILGDNYIEEANESILSQMEAKEKEMGLEFFDAEEGGFTTISDQTKFYINEAGNPVIVFDKYEIAPGAAGAVEFEIAEADETAELKENEELPADTVDLEKTFADNFEVDAATKSAYAKKIKEAVAAKDLEALADLTAFPVYVSIAENGGVVESREDFLALGVEKVFTKELAENIVNGDDTELPPSMAGFTFSKELPDITFGVGADGTLGICGINY